MWCTSRPPAKAEDTLFRVPKDRFEKMSDVFRTMFTLPSGTDCQQVEGNDDDHPLVLEGVHADNFHQILRLLYPEYASKSVAKLR